MNGLFENIRENIQLLSKILCWIGIAVRIILGVADLHDIIKMGY